jgi:hypothetical protein
LDPDPDPLAKGTDPGICILTKLLRIPNTAENYLYKQETDKTVRVECAFTAEDQTISFRPTAGSREDGGGISVT